MIIDNSLIAYEFYKDRFTPLEVKRSGEKDEDNPVFKYGPKESNAILILEDDIVNNDGYGLKKGFYNVKPDKYLDNLLIYQTGKLKAKIPVANLKIIETKTPKQQKIKSMSAKKYYKMQKKEQEKYYNGENPDEINWQEVKIRYFEEQKAWAIFYNTNNYELMGIIQF